MHSGLLIQWKPSVHQLIPKYSELHLQQIEEVFKTVGKANLHVKIENATSQQQKYYSWVIMSHKGLQTSPTQVQAIQKSNVEPQRNMWKVS